MLMVCKKQNRYGGKKRSFGDQVEIHRNDVRLVSALGWFLPFEAPKPAAKASPKVHARTVVADAPAARNPDFAEFMKPLPEPLANIAADVSASTAIEQSPDEVKPKRTYQRRDLKAEG